MRVPLPSLMRRLVSPCFRASAVLMLFFASSLTWTTEVSRVNQSPLTLGHVVADLSQALANFDIGAAPRGGSSRVIAVNEIRRRLQRAGLPPREPPPSTHSCDSCDS